jgi:hypothetical protein
MYRTGHNDNHKIVAVTDLTKATFQQILELIVITSVMVALDLSQQSRLLRILTMMVLDHTSGLLCFCVPSVHPRTIVSMWS